MENEKVIPNPYTLAEKILREEEDVKIFNPMMLQKLMRINNSPGSMYVCELSVELVYSNHRWWTLICIE